MLRLLLALALLLALLALLLALLALAQSRLLLTVLALLLPVAQIRTVGWPTCWTCTRGSSAKLTSTLGSAGW